MWRRRETFMLWRQRENPIVDGRAVDRGCRILCPISIQRLSIVVHVRRYFDKNYYYFSFFFFFSSPTRVSGPFLIRDYAGHGRLRILIFCALVLLLRRIFFPPPSVNTFSYLKSCPDHRHRGEGGGGGYCWWISSRFSIAHFHRLQSNFRLF